jgi:Short C-terminal domain
MVAGTATAVSNRVSRRQAGRWAAEEAPPQQYYAPAPPPQYAPPPPPPAGGQDDVIEKLQQLGELRTAGVLTDQEFADQKRRILGG